MSQCTFSSGFGLIVTVIAGYALSWPSRAQPIVPVDGIRGTFGLVEFLPGYQFHSDSTTQGFEPYNHLNSGSIDAPFGEYDWSIDHQSTLTTTRLSGCGSIYSNIGFESEGLAGAWLLSLLNTEFHLTSAATVRLRGRMDVQPGFGDPVGGDMVVFMDTELMSQQDTLFYLDSYDQIANVSFDREYVLPAGNYTLTSNAQIYGDDFYAPDGYSAYVSYRTILAVVDCPADITGDGLVNIQDLAELLSKFGADINCSDPADLDLNGGINLNDLTLLLADFGTSCAG